MAAGVRGVVIGIAAAALPLGGVAQEASAQAGPCVPRTNLTAIIDDSGSMRGTDPLNLRTAAMTAFVQREANAATTLAAVELGTVATGIFGPGPIGPNRAVMASAFATALVGDGGLTDYTAAFTLAARANPPADGRIFLTDGAPTDAYADAHRGGPPTYVIGLDVDSGGESLLRRIASETGGLFFPVNAPGDLGPVVNEITAVTNCDPAPTERALPLPPPGGSVSAAVGVGAADRAVSTAIFTDADIGDFVFRVAERARPESRRTARALGAAITWQVILIGAGSLHGTHQAAPGVRCVVRRRGSPSARLAARLTPRLRVTCRAGAGFVLIEASGRAGRSLRAAVGPRLRVTALRRPGTSSTGTGLSVQFTKVSRSR